MDIRQRDNETEQGEERKTKQRSNGSFWGVTMGVLILLVLVAGAWYLLPGDLLSSNNTASFDGPVAVVNGEEIEGETLARQINSLRNSSSTQAQQFNSLSETRQQEILLEGIISNKLQLQAAKAAGATVSDKAVEGELQTQIDRIGQDEFEQRLEENDTTQEEVKSNLRDQMIISNYVDQQAGGEITASDAEVQQMYDQYAARLQQSAGTSTNSAPALEELRPQIESAVIQQKRQEILTGLLEKARAEAEVEVLLDGVEYPASTPGAPAGNGTPTTEATSSATPAE